MKFLQRRPGTAFGTGRKGGRRNDGNGRQGIRVFPAIFQPVPVSGETVYPPAEGAEARRKNIFCGGKIYFVAEKYILWRENIFPGGKIYFVTEKIYFMAKKYISWRKNIFYGGKIYFLATKYISWREILCVSGKKQRLRQTEKGCLKSL
jgi:hypothetical protein